jgi:hypothetical protein
VPTGEIGHSPARAVTSLSLVRAPHGAVAGIALERTGLNDFATGPARSAGHADGGSRRRRPTPPSAARTISRDEIRQRSAQRHKVSGQYPCDRRDGAFRRFWCPIAGPLASAQDSASRGARRTSGVRLSSGASWRSSRLCLTIGDGYPQSTLCNPRVPKPTMPGGMGARQRIAAARRSGRGAATAAGSRRRQVARMSRSALRCDPVARSVLPHRNSFALLDNHPQSTTPRLRAYSPM